MCKSWKHSKEKVNEYLLLGHYMKTYIASIWQHYIYSPSQCCFSIRELWKKWIKMTSEAESLYILQQVSTASPGLSVLWCLLVSPLCDTSLWICRAAVRLLSNDVSDARQAVLMNSRARCLWHHGKWLQHQGALRLHLSSPGPRTVTHLHENQVQLVSFSLDESYLRRIIKPIRRSQSLHQPGNMIATFRPYCIYTTKLEQNIQITNKLTN